MNGGDERAVYVISVAAELAGMHPQTLRIYERKGLLRPSRTKGNTRRYSDRDIERLRTIQALTQEHGVNLAGVALVLQLREQLTSTRKHAAALEAALERAAVEARESAQHTRHNYRHELVLYDPPAALVRHQPWQD